MALKVGELIQLLTVNNTPHRRGLAQARADSEKEGDKAGRGWARAFAKRMLPGLMGLVKVSLGAFGAAMAVGAAQVAAKFAGAFLAKTVSILGPGLAAIGLLIPATIGAAVLAMGALKIATAGFGEAVSAGLSGDTEKFAEALKKLSPAARFAAQAVASLKPQLDALRTSVQDAFWGPFAYQIKQLGLIYLPILNKALTDVARSFGLAVAQLTQFLDTPASANQVTRLLTDMGVAVGNVAEGIPGIVSGLLQLVAVGASFLPGLTSGFGDLTSQFAKWMSDIAASGQLHDFISGGLSGLGDLVKIFGTLAAIVHSVFNAAIEGGLLDALQTLGGLVQRVVKEAGPGLKELISGLVAGLVALAPAAGPVGQALGAIMTAVAPLLPLLGNLATVILVALADFLRIIAVEAGPFISFLSQLASAILPMLLPVFGQIVNQVLPVAIQFFGELSAAVAPLLPLLIDVARVCIESLLPILPLLTSEGEPLRKAFIDLVQAIVPLVAMYLPGLINYLPVLFKYFEFAIRVIAPFIAIMAAVVTVITKVIGVIRAIISAIADFMGAVRGIAGTIQGIFSSAGSWLANAGERIIDGLVNGIKNAANSKLQSTLRWVTSLIPSWKGPEDKDRRLLTPAGSAIIGGLMAGISGRLPDLRGMLRGVTTEIGAMPTAGGPRAGGMAGRGDDGRLLEETQETNRLLRALKLVVGPEGLALAVRKGEKQLRYAS